MKNEVLIVLLVAVLALLMGQISILNFTFDLSEGLVALVFSLVFTFAIGLEVVK